MIRRAVSAIAIAVALSPTARADVLAPGAKWVAHKVRFENLKDFPDYTFFLKNVGWRGQNLDKDGKDKDADTRRADLQPFPPDGEGHLGGNPIDGPKWLFAVSKKLLPDPGDKPLEKWFVGDQDGVLKVELMHGRRSAPVSEKRNSFLTLYRIDIADGKMTATVVSDETQGIPGDNGAATDNADDSERLLLGGGIAIVAVLLGLFVIMRRKS